MRSIHRLVAGTVAAVAILAAIPVSGLPEFAVDGAGTPALTVVGDARYTVESAQARVRVSVALAIRNTSSETVTRRFWVDRAYLAIQPTASGLRVSGPTGGPSVRIQRTRPDHRLIEIRFGKRLYSNESLALKLSFVLRDPGGAPGRSIRIGPGLVSFPVWAFASDSTSGARATVVIPAGFEMQYGSDAFGIRQQLDDGGQRLSTGPLSDAANLHGYIVATGEAAFTESVSAIQVSSGELRTVVRGWNDDPSWTRRMGGLVDRAATALAAETGLPGPPAGLVLEEATTWALGGGSVVWDPSIGRLLVAHDAPDAAILRGIAQAFLGSDIVAERWATEGLSEAYAERAATALGIEMQAPAWNKDRAALAGPLNAWPGPAAEPTKVDSAAIATAAELGRQIIERAGPVGARASLARLVSGVSVYQPTAPLGQVLPPDKVDGPADWRRILDAFEAEAAPGTTFDDLWSTFVVRPDEANLLADRVAARDRYLVTTTSSAGWTLPAAIREALANWRFDTAQALLDEVDRAMVARSSLEATAAELGVELPDHVQPLFERGRLDAALAEADAESDALAAIAAAIDVSSPIGPLGDVGLVGETPSLDLEAARTAFEEGRIDDAVLAAAAAERTWASADSAGRSRLTLLGLLFGTLGVLLLVIRLHRPRPRGVTYARPDKASRR